MGTNQKKRLLVCWYTLPRYIPPFILSDEQITIGPKVSTEQPLEPYVGFTPFGRFDLLAALQDLHIAPEFDAIVVWSDAFGSNQPVNLGAFDCPKILCVGDTHHMESPIGKAIDYAKLAGFDFIVSSHNRQHLHWFKEAGFSNVAWMPGIKVRNLSRPFSSERKQEVGFFGAVGKWHPRRTHLLSELSRRKPFTLVACGGLPESGPDFYSKWAVSLNCSLNGDFNLRVFEILAAGGCLLTDRLSPESGLNLILEEEKEFIGYDTVDECIEQARALLAHPQHALEIAAAGHRVFRERMLPEQRAEQLLDWVFHNKLDSLFQIEKPPATEREPAALMKRIHVYEQLQEIQRRHASPSILVMGEVPEIYLSDALDLRQLRMTIGKDTRGRLTSPRVLERCGDIEFPEAATKSWDAVLLPQSFQLPPGIQAKQIIAV